MSTTQLPRFSYFPLTARGLSLLLALEEHKVRYTPHVVTFDEWPAVKASGISPFGQLPLLETQDAGAVTQSQAILRYVGGKADALGKDVAEKARHDMVVGIADDLFSDLVKAQPTVVAKDKAPAEVRKLWKETIPGRLALVEKFLGNKDRFTKAGNTVGELHLFAMLYQLKEETKQDTVLDATPNLLAFYKRVRALPAVQTVLKGKSAFGPGGAVPFFLPHDA